jgi:hypothetical protein
MKELEAYRMMSQFLDDRYRRLPSDALGGLLGEMQIAEDGLPFDPAIAQEWEAAVTAVQQSRRPIAVEHLRKAS